MSPDPIVLEGKAYTQLGLQLRARACQGGEEPRCEIATCRATWPILDTHHVIKRSRRRYDVLENVLLLCRSCHDRCDVSYAVGRIVTVHVPVPFEWWTATAIEMWLMSGRDKWSVERREWLGVVQLPSNPGRTTWDID